MLIENIKLFNNIKRFRIFLNEDISEKTIIDAVNKHKIVYIYYAGDDTILKGYRTIEPYVIGTSTAGNLVIRAFQLAGNSDSATQGNRYPDSKGRMKPGWRLFRVDRITSFLPTGKFFSNSDDRIPNGYNPDDKQMSNIIAAIQPNSTIIGKLRTKGLDSTEEPDQTNLSIDTPHTTFDNQFKKFRYFSDASKKTREATKDEIENLYDVAKKIRKKSPAQMLVVQDENGDMVLKDIAIKDKLPQDSIVGNLKDLYNKFILPKKEMDNSFFNNQLTDTLNKINKKQ